MARQRTSPFEDMILVASKLPWWMCLLLAVVAHIALHGIATRPVMPVAVTPGQMGDAVVRGLFTTLAMFGQFILPFALGIAALMSGVAAYRQKKESEINTLRYHSPAMVTKQKPSIVTSRVDELFQSSTLPGSSASETQVTQYNLPEPLEAPIKVWNETVLQIIEWKRFEIVTKEFLNMTGYEAHETKVGADGGVDIRVTKRGNDAFRGIVQCKAWNTYKVGVKPVRELYGVMAAEKVAYGMLITCGTFTVEAEEFAKGKVKLMPGWQFLEHIRKLPVEKRQRLLEIALEGDYQTPTCPQCDIKMKLRESKKGRPAGDQFWGCVRYPRCKQTLVYKSE